MLLVPYLDDEFGGPHSCFEVYGECMPSSRRYPETQLFPGKYARTTLGGLAALYELEDANSKYIGLWD